MGFWVLGFDVGVKGLGCGVWGGQWLGVRVRAQGVGFRVQGLGYGLMVDTLHLSARRGHCFVPQTGGGQDLLGPSALEARRGTTTKPRFFLKDVISGELSALSGREVTFLPEILAGACPSPPVTSQNSTATFTK